MIFLFYLMIFGTQWEVEKKNISENSQKNTKSKTLRNFFIMFGAVVVVIAGFLFYKINSKSGTSSVSAQTDDLLNSILETKYESNAGTSSVSAQTDDFLDSKLETKYESNVRTSSVSDKIDDDQTLALLPEEEVKLLEFSIFSKIKQTEYIYTFFSNNEKNYLIGCLIIPNNSSKKFYKVDVSLGNDFHLILASKPFLKNVTVILNEPNAAKIFKDIQEKGALAMFTSFFNDASLVNFINERASKFKGPVIISVKTGSENIKLIKDRMEFLLKFGLFGIYITEKTELVEIEQEIFNLLNYKIPDGEGRVVSSSNLPNVMNKYIEENNLELTWFKEGKFLNIKKDDLKKLINLTQSSVARSLYGTVRDRGPNPYDEQITDLQQELCKNFK